MTKTKSALAVVEVLASVAGFGGCVITDKSPTDGATSAELNLSLLVVDRTGKITDTLESNADVFIDLRKLDSATAVTARDFAFQVVDPAGKLMSEDDITCRTFHVGAGGFIDKVYSAVSENDATCVHNFARASDDHILVNLMPFAGGAIRFAIHAAPATTPARDDGFVHPLIASFTIELHQAVCGDGVVQTGEQCDDGNENDNDACRNDCTLPPPEPVCGNGIVETGEQCDDGNQIDTDACHNNCTLPVCGNGIVEAGEECDDGNHNNDDACRNNCTKHHDH